MQPPLALTRHLPEVALLQTQAWETECLTKPSYTASSFLRTSSPWAKRESPLQVNPVWGGSPLPRLAPRGQDI